MPSHSIVVRVRRTWVEEVHVEVPVTSSLMRVDDDGRSRLDVPAVFAEAVVMARTSDRAWRREGEAKIEVHPTQTPPPGEG